MLRLADALNSCALPRQRDGSATVVPWGSSADADAQAAPNSLTGSGPLDPGRVRGRRRCLTPRPRNLSVPHAVSSKRRDRSPRAVAADVDEHASCVPIDAATKSVLVVVESHSHGLRGDGPACRSRIVVAKHALRGNSTLGHASALIPFYLGRA